MPYPKNKIEKYTETGGINTKSSLYTSGARECNDLQNFDFQLPGAWQKRPGLTTALVGNTLTIGASQTITAIWQITKTGILAYDQPIALPQNRILVGHDQGVFKYLRSVTPGVTYVYSSFVSGLTACNWSSVNYQDTTYFCSVTPQSFPTRFYKYSPNTFPYDPNPSLVGDEAMLFGMPKPTVGLTLVAANGANNFGTSLIINYAFALRDNINFIGPLNEPTAFAIGATPVVAFTISGFTSGNAFASGLSYGFKDYVLFRDHVTGFPSDQLVRFAYTSGPSYVDQGGSGIELVPANSPVPDNSFTNLYTKYPTLLEVYQNRLFINNPDNLNRIEFSEVGQEQGDLQNFQPENFFLVNNENYTVNGFKSFNQSMIFFLQKGLVRLTGDNPSNFNLQSVTTQYGLISSKAVVEFKAKLWFLDELGIIEYNGSEPQKVSNRVETYFERMNFVAAQQRACAVHYQDRNEVWFALPIDGSDINNIILVYDYLVDAWTTFSGPKVLPTALSEIYTSYGATLAYRSFDEKHMYMGSIGASFYYFEPTQESDDGDPITCSFQTLYHNELGKSRTAQFRRFYLDSGGYNGPTLTFNLEMFPNYSSTPGYTVPLYLSQWQERIDFGIPASALSIKATHGSTLGPLVVNGYTVEYRYQRNT